MNDIVNLIVNNGLAVVVVAYFLYRDYKFQVNLNQTMQELKDIVINVKEIVVSIGEKEKGKNENLHKPE